MIIIGAGGHATEIFDVLEDNNYQKEIFFFDNVNDNIPDKLFSKYKIIKSFDELENILGIHHEFTIGVGSPGSRQFLMEKCIALKGISTSVISRHSLIGKRNVVLGHGLNIMHKVLVSSNVSIGKGTLLNTGSNIHHDVEIGKYCEIGPNVTVTGGVKIGDKVSIGAGAVLLPNIHVGNNAIIGAGSVVTKDVELGKVVKGIPAK